MATKGFLNTIAARLVDYLDACDMNYSVIHATFLAMSSIKGAKKTAQDCFPQLRDYSVSELMYIAEEAISYLATKAPVCEACLRELQDPQSLTAVWFGEKKHPLNVCQSCVTVARRIEEHVRWCEEHA